MRTILIIIVLLIPIMFGNAQSNNNQNEGVRSLRSVLTELTSRKDYNFIYSDNLIYEKYITASLPKELTDASIK